MTRMMLRLQGLARRIIGLARREKPAVALAVLIVLGVAVCVAIDFRPPTVAVAGVLGLLVLLVFVQVRREGRAAARRLDVAQRTVLGAISKAGISDEARRSAIDFGLRRVLAAFENERLAAAERHALDVAAGTKHAAAIESTSQAAMDRLEHVQSSVLANQRRVERELTTLHRDQTQEVEALLQLFRGSDPRAPMPSSGRFALSPKALLELLHLVRTRRPALVLELGSGTSSVWLAYALEEQGGRLITVDHEVEFADRTRSFIELHGLQRTAEVRTAPLKQVKIGDDEYNWYDPDAFHDVRKIDMLLVDGPPGSVGPTARYPALPVLEARLASKAMVILDDAERAGEAETCQRWIAEFPSVQRLHSLFPQLAIFDYLRHPNPAPQP